jgi:hypothetical protein
MTDTSDILAVLPSRYPSRLIGLELPLATIEELDLLADLQQLSRKQILRRIINAALIPATPNRPAGPDPIGRLAEHASVTLLRSYELAGEPKAEATSTVRSPEPDAGSSSR